MKPIVLYVDDDKANLETFNRVFKFDYDVRMASSGAEGLNVVKVEPELALIVTDQRMPQMTGIEFLKEAMRLNPHAQRIILTAFTDTEALLKAIQEGHVYDYVVKPWEPKELKSACDKAIAIYSDRIEKIKQLMVAESKAATLAEEVKSQYNYDGIIGADGGLAATMEQVRKASSANATILIRGETGTGKELIARAIHSLSPRRDGPFVAVHCAALGSGVLESELFGHEKGSFTGAMSGKKGRFELADGGTLFLDEIGDLPESVQIKILRALQERSFERVGGVETKKVDVRLIAATHQPLEELVQVGKFRQDLFYRLNVVPIVLPPLRERRSDIPRLIFHFLAKYNHELGKGLSISKEAEAMLTEYDWPGNVRELQNVIERAAIFGEAELAQEDFNLAPTTIGLNNQNVLESIKSGEANKIANALREAKGNISEAARILGAARSTLMYRLKKFGVLIK